MFARYVRFMHLQQRKAARRGQDFVTIISDEPPQQLARLCHELEQRGIESVVQPAGSPARVGVGYIRTIDPPLGGGSSFVQVAALGAKPALMVNTPGSVRIAEWSPLATHALRDRGVPQPSRLWCFDEGDIPRVSEVLGTPIAFEGVVTQRRVVASAPGELERAFADAVGSHPERGAMAEAPIRADAAHVVVMVIDDACIPVRGRQMRSLSPLASMRAAVVAGDAVAALGGSAMAVEITIDQNDNAYVTRVDPAPQIDRLNADATAALVGAIAARLTAVWPSSQPRQRMGRAIPTPAFSRVGHPC
jgi:hypothetical protein